LHVVDPAGAPVDGVPWALTRGGSSSWTAENVSSAATEFEVFEGANEVRVGSDGSPRVSWTEAAVEFVAERGETLDRTVVVRPAGRVIVVSADRVRHARADRSDGLSESLHWHSDGSGPRHLSTGPVDVGTWTVTVLLDDGTTRRATVEVTQGETTQVDPAELPRRTNARDSNARDPKEQDAGDRDR
jgi:hypothetical protein